MTSGYRSERFACNNHADVTSRDAKACGDDGVSQSLLCQCSDLANLFGGDSGASLAQISAGFCAESPLAPRQAHCHAERGSAVSACALDYAHASAVGHYEDFIVPNTSMAVPGGIATLARWHEIVWGVISAVLVKVVSHELADSCAFAGKPIDVATAPVAWMRAAANFFKQHALMFAESASQCCERMVSIADAEIRIWHGSNSINSSAK